MTRLEIRVTFRAENPKITTRVIADSVLNDWLLIGNQDFCARTRCIVDQEGTTITTAENDTYWDLTDEIDNFFDIDIYPAGGVLYNNKPLEKTTIAALDEDTDGRWRSYSSGTPKKWFRRGKYLYVDRPIDSEADDITVYAILIPDDFDSDSEMPFNELTYLEPYHSGLVKYLTWRAKVKVGKRQAAIDALAEYETYAQWTEKQLGVTQYAKIYFQPKA